MSQTVGALLGLRQLILGGELSPGERLSEVSVAERLGVSRTPVRAALAKLEEEGLLEPIPSGGYSVRAFAESEILDAIELRGTLEGLAARMAAERGVPAGLLGEMAEVVAAIDALLIDGVLREADFPQFVAHNERFHALLVEAAGSPVLARQIARTLALPFASPSGFVRAQAALPEARAILTIAQEQHRNVLEAIAAREGARAEALMREHARVARRNLQLALRGQAILELIPGAALIRRRVKQ
jgi:GntR family transcriptional regulator of vanillate catabolism